MEERSEPPTEPFRLVMEFGETIELDGSMIWDPTAEGPVQAVLLRMPPHRAAWFSRVIAAYSRLRLLLDTAPDGIELTPAWALDVAAEAAGHVEPDWAPDSRRTSAAAVLRRTGGLDDITVTAVIDAAARWLEQPDGPDHAWALLGAVTDNTTRTETYAALTGSHRRAAGEDAAE